MAAGMALWDDERPPFAEAYALDVSECHLTVKEPLR